MKFYIAIVCLVATFLSAQFVQADFVQYSVTGTIATSSDDHTPSLEGGTFAFQFQIDLDTLVDSKPANTIKGDYQGQLTGAFDITLGGDTYSGTLFNGGNHEQFEITNKSNGDEIDLEYSFAGPSINFGGSEIDASKIHIHLSGPNTAFDSIIPADLAGVWWDNANESQIEFGNQQLDINIVSFTAVAIPEPSALALLPMLALGWVRRKKIC